MRIYQNLMLLGVVLSVGVCCGRQVQGPKGDRGEIGRDGRPLLVETLPDAPGCPAGGRTLLLGTDENANGQIDPDDGSLTSMEVCDGITGGTGAAGTAGTDGVNGIDGTNGVDAVQSPYTPVDLISFCGDLSRTWAEVGMRLSNGTIIASMSDNVEGRNTRWVILRPGHYATTDGFNCAFTLNNDGSISR